MSGKLICRVCGKEYDGCRTAKYISGQFRWQDVACCPEHGSIYLERIIASRSKKNTAEKKEDVIIPVVIEEETEHSVNEEPSEDIETGIETEE